MKRPCFTIRHLLLAAAIFAGCLSNARSLDAQATPAERSFRAPKSTVEKALKQLQPATSGRLPALEGFAVPGDHPLSRYQHGFYQCSVQVSATPSGESVVKVSAKVTAWYADPSSLHSGYELLRSNGRIEEDLLDQLGAELASVMPADRDKELEAIPAATKTAPAANETTLSAPMPRSSKDTGALSFARSGTPPNRDLPTSNSADHTLPERTLALAKVPPREGDGVQAEIAALEEVLKNQARPKNLVSVKKSGTAVVGSPSLSGKTLFMASAHDEFELLDYNADWVHVRISGLSRGWIWRTSLEMPEGIPDVPNVVATSAPAAADLFHVSREETAPFPGDWEPLRGKSVKIISVQKVRESEQEGGPGPKLEFAKSLLDGSYDELAKSTDQSGLVLIFDSADGGMIAATFPTIRQWKAGTLSDSALWHQCYFDPPETFNVSSAGGTR